jgi:hypothetical protein
MRGGMRAGVRRRHTLDGMGEGLPAYEEARWRCVHNKRVELTSHTTEPVLRANVPQQKGCFGAQRAEVNHFVEHILRISATCRQQQLLPRRSPLMGPEDQRRHRGSLLVQILS